jgi:hypothetical protein
MLPYKLFNAKINIGVFGLILFLMASTEVYGQSQVQSILFSSPTMNTSVKHDTTWKADRGDVKLRKAGYIVGISGLAVVGAGIPLVVSVINNTGDGAGAGGFVALFVSGVFLGSGCAMTVGGASMLLVGQIKISRDKKRHLSLNYTPVSVGLVYSL